MADDRPQLYLVTPPVPDPELFPTQLARILDSVAVACLRLSLASQDEDAIIRLADQLRDIAHGRDVALVIDRHVQLVERLGLDGVHLDDGARRVRRLRQELGPDAIIGAHCGTTRHDGINAAEAGADYVTFGPVGPSPLGDGAQAAPELFEWWSEMIEVPVVVEGALTPALITRLTPYTDFFALGEEIWATPDPLAELQRLVAAMGAA